MATPNDWQNMIAESYDNGPDLFKTGQRSGRSSAQPSPYTTTELAMPSVPQNTAAVDVPAAAAAGVAGAKPALSPAGAAVGGLGGLAQVGVGIWQGVERRNLQKSGPSKYIPQAVLDTQAARAQGVASQKMPGLSDAENQLQSSLAQSANTLAKVARTPSEALSAINSLGNNALEKQQNLGIANAQSQRVAQEAKLNQDNLVGQYQQNNYQQWRSRLADLQSASTQNIWGGSMTAASSLALAI